jgi:DNA repair exonuclease SbcCD ATPase subunit
MQNKTMIIGHMADLQINCSGNTNNRRFEYAMILDNCLQIFKSQEIDVLVVSGDVFERHNVSEQESELWLNFVHNLHNTMPNLDIIVIDGNHDVKKRNMSFFDGQNDQLYVNKLHEISQAIHANWYHYTQGSRLLALNKYPDTVFACWSELAKYDNRYGNVSPYEQLDAATFEALKSSKYIIDLYHGTVAGVSDFGLPTSHEFSDDKYVDGLRGHICLAGDIHKPQVIKTKSGNLYYPSSTATRNFKEGIRISSDGSTAYDHSLEHGVMIHTVMPDKRTTHAFHTVHQPITYLTICVGHDSTKESMSQVLANYMQKHTRIKVVLDKPNAEALSHLYYMANKWSNMQIVKTEHANIKLRSNANLQDQQHDNDNAIELNTDNFIDICKPLLTNYLANLNLPEDFRNAVYDKTVDFIRQECGFHLHAQRADLVVLKHLIIDNFRTISHVDMHIPATGLTNISGQNGHGKTTILEAISMACTMQPYDKFPKNAKKQQYIKLFNDKLGADSVLSIQLNFSVNDNEYSSRISMSRIMSANYDGSENWKQFVDKVIVVNEIYQGSQLLHSGDDAIAFLASIFGDYMQFKIMHMLNSHTMHELVNMTDDEIGKFVLHRLGYNVLQKLEYFFNGCKFDALGKIKKPDTAYNDLLQARLDNENAIATCKTEIARLQDAIVNIETIDIPAITDDINGLRNKLVLLPDNLITTWRTRLADKEHYTIESINIELSDTDKLVQRLTKEQLSVIDLENSKSKAFDDLSTLQKTYDIKKTELLKSISKQLTDQYTDLDKQEQNLRTVISDYDKTLQIYKDAVKEHKNDIERKTEAYNTANATLSNAIKVYNSYREKTCPECGQSLLSCDKDLVAELTTMYNDIIEQQNKLAEMSIGIDASKSALAALIEPDKIDKSELLNTIIADKSSVMKQQEHMHSDEYVLQVMQLNAKSLVEQLDNAKLKYQHETDKLAKSAKSSTDYTNDINSAMTKHSELLLVHEALVNLAAYQQTIIDNNEYNKQIAEKQSKLDQLRASVLINTTAKNTNETNKLLYEKNIITIDQDIQDTIQYDITTFALKAYQSLISDLVPPFLYKNACAVVNAFIAKLNLPNRMQLTLSDQVFGGVFLVDTDMHGDIIYRHISQSSGMEETIVGLALCFALHYANAYNGCKFVGLDEMTGKLSTGTAEDTTNYLQVYADIINIIKNDMQVIMIDHRLQPEFYDKVVKIVRDQVTNVSSAID